MVDEGVDLRVYWYVFLKWWWLFILGVAAATLSAFFLGRGETPLYHATTKVLVQGRPTPGIPTSGDLSTSRELASYYGDLITTRPVMDQVVDALSLPYGGSALAGKISVSSRSTFLHISVRDADPNVAAKIANTVAEVFIEDLYVRQLAQISQFQLALAQHGIDQDPSAIVAAQAATLSTLSILEDASPPGSPAGTKMTRNLILASVVGLVLAGLLVFVLEYLDDTIKSPDQIDRKFGVTALGIMLKWSPREIQEGDMLIAKLPSSIYAEAIRQVRANLQFATVSNPGKVFLVSSPGPEEGKSTIASNLAVALAQMGRRVVLVDGDMRRPTLHRMFKTVEREPGLSNYLAELDVELEDVVHPTDESSVYVLPCGTTPPNPAELLGAPKMKELLDRLSQEYDTVLVDSPPVLPFADGPVIAAQVDGAILVVDGYATRSSALQAALGILRNTKVNILGVVINKIKRPGFGYGYGYPYYYQYYTYYSRYSDVDGNHMDGHARLHQRLGKRAKNAWTRIRGGQAIDRDA